MDRRFFLKSIPLVTLLPYLPTLALPGRSKTLILQCEAAKKGNYAIAFIDLERMTTELVEIPYWIHSVSLLGQSGRFVATSKGAKMFFFSRSTLLQTIDSPENIAFDGHSTLSEDGQYLFTSAIDYVGFDRKAFRHPNKHSSDKTDSFGMGKILKISTATGKISDVYPSGGQFPHEHILKKNNLMILHANSTVPSKSGSGEITVMDLSTGKIKERIYCAEKEDCPTLHKVQGKTLMAITGLPEKTTFHIFSEDNHLKKIDMGSKALTTKRSEFLNSAFLLNDSIIGIVSLDISYFGVWDIATGKLLREKSVPGIISVDAHDDLFLAQTDKGLLWMDAQLTTKRFMSFAELGLPGKITGPHSKIIEA